MKNVKNSMKKAALFMTLEEFKNFIYKLTNGRISVEAEYVELYYNDVNDEGVNQNEINEMLSEYYDIYVTSIHADNCDVTGVWIVYKDMTLAEYQRYNNALQAYTEIAASSDLEENNITYAEYGEMGFILDGLYYDGKAQTVHTGIKNFFERFGMKTEANKEGTGWMIYCWEIENKNIIKA